MKRNFCFATMKKLVHAAVAIAAALALASCVCESQANGDNCENEGLLAIEAYTEGKGTRATLHGDDEKGYFVHWTEEDSITFQWKGKAKSGVFKLHEGAGNSRGVFKGRMMMYPKQSYNVWYASGIVDEERNSWPAHQEYGGVWIDEDLWEDGVSYAPMYSVVTIGDDGKLPSPIKFQNLGGLLRLEISGTETVDSIIVSANENMAGHFSSDTCQWPSSRAPSIISDGAASKSITLDCKGEELEEGGTRFYVAMPEGEYSNVAVEIFTNKGDVIKKEIDNSIAIKRNKIKPLALTTKEEGKTYPPLCFTAEEDNVTITMNKSAAAQQKALPIYQTSSDGVNWTDFKYTSISNPYPTITLEKQGDKVYFRNKLDNEGRRDKSAWQLTSSTRYVYFVINGGKAAASGSIRSLMGINYNCDEEAPIIQYRFNHLFYNCENLTKAPDVSIPHVSEYCFYSAFEGCTNLEEVPEIEFIDTYGGFSFGSMFKGCQNLKYIKCLAAQINSSSFTNWLSGVSEVGTFVQKRGVDWPRGASGIPTNWIIEKVD